MHAWLLIRRLRGPAFIILLGVTALLNQWGILRFSRSWPLYLIFAGIFGLLERVVLSGPLPPVYPGATPGSYPTPYAGNPAAANSGAASGYSDPLAPLAPSTDPERRA